MGLALHNPSDSLYLSNLTEHRHLPGRRENPGEKYQRRPFHWSRSKLSKIDWRYEQAHDTQLWQHIKANFSKDGIPGDAEDVLWDDWPPQLKKKHHLAALAFQASRGRRNKYNGLDGLDARLQYRSAPSPSWTDDEEEGRALARSSMQLPEDRRRGRRPPSLERQEAFRDSTTSRKRGFSGMSELMEEEELYRLGLLYDDEHERGSGFTLGTILHNEPLFNIRPAKRGRGRKGKRASESHAFAADLPLHLSFSALGEDEALAAFLISPDDNELVPEAREPASSASPHRERKSASQPSLTTIYELELEHSADFLSEANTQTSSNFGRAPTYFDFLGLLSDSEYNNNEEEEEERENEGTEEEDEEEGEAWALLDTLKDDAKEGTEDETESDGTLSPTHADAWIMLGDDS